MGPQFRTSLFFLMGPVMPTLSLPEDKPKIAFYAFMMFIQNFGFFLMYFLMYIFIPGGTNPASDTCDTLRFWVAFFAMDCFVESFCCVWMGMAGYTDDNTLFPICWILHLVVAQPYCLCTVTIPISIYSDDGKACLAAGGQYLYPLKTVFWTHCILFLVYVWMMLSITYYSWAKATLFKGGKAEPSAANVVEVSARESSTVEPYST